MNTKKKICIAAIALLSAFALFAGGMCLSQYLDAKNSDDAFNNLAEQIVEVEVPETVPEPTEKDEAEEEPEVDPAVEEARLAHEKYAPLFEQNQDFIGWICIEDTNINYPVMQSPDNPDFYLKHGFDKNYSDYGVPYIDEACATGISNNLVIYGHHMNNGSMFANLVKYTDKTFYEAHPVIKFDTLSTLGEYEIVAVFTFDTNHEKFRYNEYTDMDEEEFAEFMENVRARALYDTGVEAKYGDRLLTLSTCEYSHNNGRFVVVARKK